MVNEWASLILFRQCEVKVCLCELMTSQLDYIPWHSLTTFDMHTSMTRFTIVSLCMLYVAAAFFPNTLSLIRPVED